MLYPLGISIPSFLAAVALISMRPVLQIEQRNTVGIIRLIVGSEQVKIEGARLLLSQVSGATRSTATDTAGGDGREEGQPRGRREGEEGETV